MLQCVFRSDIQCSVPVFLIGNKASGNSLEVYFLLPPKDAAKQGFVVSAWPAGENPGAEGEPLFTVSPGFSL